MISMIQNNILWSPLQIGGLTTKNRFAVLPMECADAAEGGHLSQDMLMRYDRYAEGRRRTGFSGGCDTAARDQIPRPAAAA